VMVPSRASYFHRQRSERTQSLRYIYRPLLAIACFFKKRGSGADYRFVDIETLPSANYCEIRIISTFVKSAAISAQSVFAITGSLTL
jgi:hypothetical protein